MAVTDFPTIEAFVGQTPLVRLQRMAAHTQSTVLLKLEGNNPAGSVKDRPALNMILQAELRGQIKPGDTIIEATSGNTGIALAMAAAIKGYRMILIMPDNATAERKASMQAYGATLLLVSKAQGMEGARDLALQLQAQGKGIVLDQFNNPDNPAAHLSSTGPEIWQQSPWLGDAFCLKHGHNRHHHGGVALFKAAKSSHSNHRLTTRGRQFNSGHQALANGLSAWFLSARAR